MSSPVIVLTSDSIRGSILKKILTQSGFKVLWFKNYYDARVALDEHVPRAVVFDAKGLHSREAGSLAKLRDKLPDAGIIVLAEAGAIPTFEAEGCPSDLCLPEPIDPELVVSKVKEIVSSPPVERTSDGNAGNESGKETGKETVIDFLKQFLRLD